MLRLKILAGQTELLTVERPPDQLVAAIRSLLEQVIVTIGPPVEAKRRGRPPKVGHATGVPAQPFEDDAATDLPFAEVADLTPEQQP